MLPNLPKTLEKKEAKFGLQFRKWIMSHPQLSGAYELKQCSSAFPFSELSDKQILALQLVNSDNGFLYKAPDDTQGSKVLDYYYYRNAPAYVVIKYPKEFSIISINTFLLEKKRSKRKSLTMLRARELSTVTVKTH